MTTLFDAIRSSGWTPVKRKHPWRCRDRVGSPQETSGAAALTRNRVAVVDNLWDYAYAASHELAEVEHQFQHSEKLFCTQANILARWHRFRGGIHD